MKRLLFTIARCGIVLFLSLYLRVRDAYIFAIWFSKKSLCCDFVRYIKGLEEEVKLMLWDTAGQEQFHAMTRAYYRGLFFVILLGQSRCMVRGGNYALKCTNIPS
jgi:GTPase SAR1 family protein